MRAKEASLMISGVWQDGVTIACEEEDGSGRPRGVGTRYEGPGSAKLILRFYQWSCQVGSWFWRKIQVRGQ